MMWIPQSTDRRGRDVRLSIIRRCRQGSQQSVALGCFRAFFIGAVGGAIGSMAAAVRRVRQPSQETPRGRFQPTSASGGHPCRGNESTETWRHSCRANDCLSPRQELTRIRLIVLNQPANPQTVLRPDGPGMSAGIALEADQSTHSGHRHVIPTQERRLGIDGDNRRATADRTFAIRMDRSGPLQQAILTPSAKLASSRKRENHRPAGAGRLVRPFRFAGAVQ